MPNGRARYDDPETGCAVDAAVDIDVVDVVDVVDGLEGSVEGIVEGEEKLTRPSASAKSSHVSISEKPAAAGAALRTRASRGFRWNLRVRSVTESAIFAGVD